MMKRVTSLLSVFCLLLVQSTIQLAHASAQDEYDEAVEYLLDNDIADGYDDGDFRGYKNINRAEFTKIIMLATQDEDDIEGNDCFYDVHREWFADYVCTAQDEDIVEGYPDGTFRPGQFISLAEAASIITKAYDGDTDEYGEWYMPYIDQLDDWDALPPTMNSVHSPLTREQMAYIIWKVEEGDEDDDDDEDEDEEIDVSIDASADEVATGETVTFTIELENNSDDDLETDVEVHVDEGLDVRSAEDADARTSLSVIWGDVEVNEDDTEELTFTAVVLEGYAGKTLDIDVETDDDDDSVSVNVKKVIALPSSSDPVLFWNNVALQANAEDATGTYGVGDAIGPGSSSRALAIVQTAVYDAVNSIEKTHQPYIAFVPVAQNEKVSVDAAVAAAAYKTMLDVFPRQKSMLDITYQGALFRIPDGAEETAGIRVGEASAKQVLDARKNDGSTVEVTYNPGNEPGKHRVDPTNPNQPFMGANWGNVKPFALTSGTQFRSSPPPALTSKEYADAFNELKLYGGDGVTTATVRTQDQTDIGIFWAYDGVKKVGTPPRLYNQIAQVIAKQKGNTVAENARLFALINIAIADAGVVCWESKYYYNFWRPIVGIREADVGTGPTGLGDNNPLTQGDANWTPLGAPMSNMTMNNFTPPFPSYPSGHATFGTATFKVIEQFYGTNNIAFTFTSDELNGVTTDNKGVVRPLKPRTFQNLDQAIKENADSRVYLGVHWRFDQDEGIRMGEKIADYVFEHTLEPLN